MSAYFDVSNWSSCLDFGPFQDTNSLLAVGGLNEINIKECVLNKSEIDKVRNISDAISLEDVISVRCNVGNIKSIAWSPQSAISSDNEHYIKLALVGCNNSSIKLLSFDGTDVTITDVGPQRNSINSIAFHPFEPKLLASVGNDLVCKIWDIEADRTVSEFKLTSPGMSVSFHPNQMSQLLVTELSGIIRLYNIETKSPILSLECSGKTLVHADWSKANGLKVGGVGGSNWYLWDMSQYSVPYETQPVANGGPLTRFKWCNTSDSVFATLGMKGLFQIHHYNHQKIPVTSSLPVIKDISWHPSLPVTFSLTNNQIVSWEVLI